MSAADNDPVLALLAASAAFAGLDAALRQRLAAKMDLMSVGAGATLLRQGDLGDALFVIASGALEIRLCQTDGSTTVIDTAGPGDCVGEMQIVVGGEASATVSAAVQTRLARLRREDFDELSTAEPALLEALAGIVRKRLRRVRMHALLPLLLGPLDAEAWALVEARVEWVSLQPGEFLFRQGDVGDGWYAVLSGRLAVLAPETPDRRGPEGSPSQTLGSYRSASARRHPDEPAHDDAPRLIAEVGIGEGVGELGLLAQQARSASVQAMRHSDLLRLSADAIDQLAIRRPDLGRAVLGAWARRMSQQGIRTAPAQAASLTIAIVPVSAGVNVDGFSQRLARALERFGTVLRVDSAGLDRIGVHASTANCPDSHPAWIRVDVWLDEQGMNHRFMLLSADATPNTWSARVVSRADRVMLLAEAGAHPDLGAHERSLAALVRSDRSAARRLLVLLHRDGTHLPQGTARWLQAHAVDSHLHIRLDREGDIQRLARTLAGRALALVLSGGGARGYAHWGVVRALRERGIEVDLVAGTSSGAQAAYMVAAEYSDEAMLQAARRMHEARPFKGWTLPMFSLLRGDRLTRVMQQCCGEAKLEDLWRPCIAVSSNLTRLAVELHERGPVWLALRASSALPGVLEPQLLRGELLVDGCVIDNLPVAVARQRISGRVLAVDVSTAAALSFQGEHFPSPWKTLLARLLGLQHDRPPGLAAVLINSLLLASMAHTRVMRQQADLSLSLNLEGFGMTDTGRYHELIEAGYHQACEQLQGFVPDS
jgi:predicted acylesterase/phospholipase RssA/CRP-like cAMP-binding protein